MLWVPAAVCLAHPAPPNLMDYECPIYRFAAEFGGSKFPAGTVPALHAIVKT